MDGLNYIAERGKPANTAEFLNTVKFLKRSAWNAYPCRNYFGMVTVEQADGGWTVSMAPAGAGDAVNTLFFAHDEEDAMALEVARKMHPTLICACSSCERCFTGNCAVRP
jgi:hypothetical protein